MNDIVPFIDQSLMSTTEAKEILTIALLSAFADGSKSPQEREQLREITEALAGPELNTAELYRDVLLKKARLEQAVAGLGTPESRQLAYEMAVAVCDADGAASPAERAFLDQLNSLLGLPVPEARALLAQAESIVSEPLVPQEVPPQTRTPASPEVDKMIVRYAVLAGALELLPQSMASLAILPLQIKMVYRIGQAHGVTLDQGHIKEFIATLGIGWSAQMLDGMARKFLGKLVGRMAGGLAGSVTRSAGSAALAFSTTWALGQVARQYYSSGRRLDMTQLRNLFASLRQQGRQLHDRHAAEIQQQATGLDVPALLSGRIGLP